MDQVHQNIWVSDIQEVCESPIPNDVDRVITVCQDSVADNVACEYTHYNMADGEVDMYGGSSDYSIFESAALDLLESVQNGKSVLIHCHMGQSRSVSVCMAVLSVVENIPIHESYGRLKDARGEIHPDETLREHAKRFVSENGLD